MKKVFAFQEYTPQVTQGIGWKIPLIRVAVLVSIVVVPVLLLLLAGMVRVLPFHGLLIATSLAAYLPLALYRKPSVKVDSNFQVTFDNRPMVNRELLHASLLSVTIFTLQAVGWAFALADKLHG